MKKSILSYLFVLPVLVAFCFPSVLFAKENPAVTAKLKKKYQDVTFINKNGLEYYELSRNNPDDYGYLYGIADVKGKVIIPYSKNFSYISPLMLQNGALQEFYSDTCFWYLMTTDEKCGVADRKGKIIIPCMYRGTYLTGYNELNPFINFDYKRDGWVFIMHADNAEVLYDEKGKMLIPASRGYTSIHPYVNAVDGIKYFEVEKENKRGLCDANGKELLPPVYKAIIHDNIIYKTKLRFFVIVTDKGYGLYDYIKKQIILPPEYYVTGTEGNLYYYMEEDEGEKKIFFEGKLITTAKSLIPNSVVNKLHPEEKYSFFGKDNKFGLINETTGKLLPITSDDLPDIKDGCISVINNGVTSLYSLKTLEEGKVEPLASITREEAAKSIVSDVDKNIPKAKTTDENTFAVIIANENYNDFIVPSAGNDGKIFKEYCLEALGIPKDNIIYYEDATINNLYAVVKRLKDLAEVYDEGFNVIFYYSGQGITDERTKEMYLFPSDGTLKAVSSTCYSISKLYGEIGTLPNVEQALFLIDAPFNGYTRENKPLEQARAVAIKSVPNQVAGKTVAIEAATEGETAHVYPAQNHGLFTYCLLKALQTSPKKPLVDLVPDVLKTVKEKSTNEMKVPQNILIKKANP